MPLSPKETTYSSQPELSTCNMEDSEFITSRKRKLRHTDDEITDLRCELRKMFSSMKEDQDSKFRDLNVMIKEIKDQNKEIIQSNSTLQKALEESTTICKDLKHKYDNIMLDNEAAHAKINVLESQIEDLLRKQRETTIEIKNVPISNSENLIDIVSHLHNVVELPISPEGLRQVYKKKVGQNIVIVVEYQTVQSRVNLLKAVKTYNQNHQEDKLNTKILQIPGDKLPVYISESLTSTARKLHYLAREAQKKHDFKFCWVSNGRIFIKKNEGSPTILINSVEQIEGIVADIVNTNTSRKNIEI